MVDVSLEEAYRKWSSDLVGYATVLVGPADAADVVGEVFTSLVRRGQSVWREVREPRAYLFGAVFKAAQSWRRQRRRADEERWPVVVGADVELLADAVVVGAVARLSVQQRAAIYFTYWEDLTPAEVARVLGVSEGAIRRQLARARAKLRKGLQ